jgi:hypothetical protein
MATRKSAKGTGKKRASRSKSSAKKSSAAKRTRSKTSASKKALKNVRRAGKKTWEALKSTTTQVIRGVKSTLD